MPTIRDLFGGTTTTRKERKAKLARYMELERRKQIANQNRILYGKNRQQRLIDLKQIENTKEFKKDFNKMRRLLCNR